MDRNNVLHAIALAAEQKRLERYLEAARGRQSPGEKQLIARQVRK